jgi:hypothetical protein
MHVLIDRTNMAFKARHQDIACLALLADIETPHCATVLLPDDLPRWFKTFTDLELRLLIKNTTGKDHPNAYRANMLATVAMLAQQLPPRTDLNMFDLGRQCAYLEALVKDDEEDEGKYKYIEGAAVPQRQADLFESPTLTHTRQLDDTAVQALQRVATAAATVATTPARSPSTRPASTVRGTGAALPKGAGRKLIWNTMDRIWEEAGKPTDIKVILTLRKQCMDELAPQGVIRTSCSSDLGGWQKERVPK